MRLHPGFHLGPQPNPPRRQFSLRAGEVRVIPGYLVGPLAAHPQHPGDFAYTDEMGSHVKRIAIPLDKR
jgi:hypothetical protein